MIFESENIENIPIVGDYLMALWFKAITLSKLKKVFERIFRFILGVLFVHPFFNFLT